MSPIREYLCVDEITGEWEKQTEVFWSCPCVCVCVCVWSTQSSWLCVWWTPPALCDEVRMRAVVPYARHQRAEELPDARGEDGAGETCGSRPREALNVALTPRQKKNKKLTLSPTFRRICPTRAAPVSHIDPFLVRLPAQKLPAGRRGP